ncbi:YHS domain-containing protein [Bacillus sp. V33-4]|uniref:YHS domain-containing protein n=1 Tax=Bacillus sp. V33-4 TaxID=2054169 RepID=UPI000C78724A|nr:YHS domain-containing protein [Bacillus sp. V33-4]PLR84003.1 hypothetical protein CVD23_12730 [Bacillus sp. V33-4]
MFFRKKETDPVCGMEIKVTNSTIRSGYQGSDYYFCSTDCLGKFNMEPQKFIAHTANSDELGHQHGEHHHHRDRGKQHDHEHRLHKHHNYHRH